MSTRSAHAVNYNYRSVPLLVIFQCQNQTRRIFTIHYVNNKNNVCCAEIVINGLPLSIGQRGAKVVRRQAQLKLIFTVKLPLGVFQRRQ
jgi:hypothetical protein